MGFATKEELEQASGLLSPTRRCFACGNNLEPLGSVFWHGIDEKGQEIWLHRECAIGLARHLIRDAMRAEPPEQSSPLNSRSGLVSRISEYLQMGGLFNPELMEHDKVRDLLMECRECLSKPSTGTLPGQSA